MFRWYKESDVCYVYLTDVMSPDVDFSEKESAFGSSKWFTRGWTLQELLAPRQVRFFSYEWELIGQLTEGSKLTEVVSKVTGIPPAYLEGANLRLANVAQKMSWASKRETTRMEDIAYCLLGIFDVNMPLLYGEGTKAFRRLQEEIMKQTHDHTLLAWGLLPWHPSHREADKDHHSVLAASPRDFMGSGDLLMCKLLRTQQFTAYSMTNRGLQIELPLIEGRSGRWLAQLGCFERDSPESRLGIILERVGNTFVRTSRALLVEGNSPEDSVDETPLQNLLILVDQEDLVHSDEHFVSVDLPQDYCYEVQYVDPSFEVKPDLFRALPDSLRIYYPPGLQKTDLKRQVAYHLMALGDRLVKMVKRHMDSPSSSRPNSVKLQLLLTEKHKHNSTSTLDEPTSFIFLLEHHPGSHFKFRLAPPLPEGAASGSCPSTTSTSIETNNTSIGLQILRSYMFDGDTLVKIKTGPQISISWTVLPTVLLTSYKAGEWREWSAFVRDTIFRNAGPIAGFLLFAGLSVLPVVRGMRWAMIFIPLCFKPRRGPVIGNPQWDRYEEWICIMALMFLGFMMVVTVDILGVSDGS